MEEVLRLCEEMAVGCLLFIYDIENYCILRSPTAGFAELNGRDALLPSRQSERLYAAKGS